MKRHRGPSARGCRTTAALSRTAPSVVAGRFGHVVIPGFHETCGLRFHEALAVVGNHPHAILEIGAVEPFIEPRRR